LGVRVSPGALYAQKYSNLAIKTVCDRLMHYQYVLLKGTTVLVNDWAEKLWPLLNVTKKTRYDYKRLYERYLRPLVGDKDLEDDLRQIIQLRLLELPPQTSRHCLMVAKTMWREGYNYGVCKNNPTAGIKTPKIQLKPKPFLTWDEVDSRDWGRYNNQIRFLALHGLRWSEAVVVTQNDIREGALYVTKTIYGPCKSATSVRKIPYLGYFERFPVTYKPLMKAAHLHGITVHSLRRTYAYLLKTQGIHVTTAQRLLGHADPVLTLKVYTGVLDSEIDDAGKILQNSLKIRE
jgi:integrase